LVTRTRRFSQFIDQFRDAMPRGGQLDLQL
jgi:hypothetical protein